MRTSRARATQERLRDRLVLENTVDLAGIKLVAGADVSYLKGDERMFAAVVVMSYPALDVVESRWGSAPVSFPYIPGFLAFREIPSLLPVFRRLKKRPQVVLVDGHGVAHPRRFGIASHVGVLLGIPTVGVAKSVLVGEYRMPGKNKGSSTPLIYRGEVIGRAVRTRDDVRPVFVSVGNMIDLETSERLTLSCCRGYRLPQPSRMSHMLSNRARKSGGFGRIRE